MGDPLSHESRAYVVSSALIVSTIVAMILTMMRMYVRIWMIKLVGWDDFFNVLAMVSASRSRKDVNIINGLCIVGDDCGDGPNPCCGAIGVGETPRDAGSGESSTLCDAPAYCRVFPDCLNCPG